MAKMPSKVIVIDASILRTAGEPSKIDQRSAKCRDTRLIEAAFVADSIVISLDDKARNHFSKVSVQITKLKRISWINPNVKSDQYIRWMEEGAKSLKDHKLG